MKRRMNKVNLVDYFIGILIIFIFTWSPNFGHGYIVGPDEGQHLAWINEILHGKTVYKEIYMFYGPLLEFMPIIFMKIFGISLWSLRLFYQLSNMFNIVLGFLILKLVVKTRTFLYLGLWALLSTKVTEFWMARWGGARLTLALCAVWLIIYYAKKGKRPALFLGGVFTGLALFTSQEIGLVLLFASILFLFFLNFHILKRIEVKSFIRIVFLYIGGFIISILPFVIYLLTKGAFLDYIRIVFIDLPFKYPKYFVEPEFTQLLFISLFSNLKIPFPFDTRYFLYYLLSILIYGLGFGYIIWNSIAHRMTRRKILIFFILLFGFPLFLSSFRQIIGEQISLYSPPIVVTAIFLLEMLFILSKKNLIIQRKKFNIKKLIIAIFCLIVIQDVFLILFIKSTPYKYAKGIINSYLTLKKDAADRFYRFTDTSIASEEKYARLSGEWNKLGLVRAKGIFVPEKQAEAITGAIEFIKENTASSEEIFVFPHEGQYYFLADRPSITRFTPCIYASIDIDYQRQIVNDLETKRPRYCIYVRDAYVFTDYNKIPNEKRLSLVFGYLKDNYLIKKQYGQTLILERKIL